MINQKNGYFGIRSFLRLYVAFHITVGRGLAPAEQSLSHFVTAPNCRPRPDVGIGPYSLLIC